MKKLIAITTSLCAVTCAAVFSGAAAFAQDAGLDVYPQDFSKEIAFERLDDYAVGKNKYAFLENNVIFEYDGVNFYSYEDGSLEITGVYYKNGTTLCYGSSDGNIYVHGTNDEPVEIETDEIITADGYIYTAVSGGVEVYKQGSGSVETLVDFSNPKAFNGKAYAVKDNALYGLKGTDEPEKLELKYLDFSPAKNIKTGGCAQVIKEFGLNAPQFVTLKGSAFMTEINIDALDGEYFSAGKTVKAESLNCGTALLLARLGTDDKISVVMVSGDGAKSKCYLMNSDDAPIKAREAVKAKELGATVTVDDAYIYSAPYVCKSTQLTDIKSGDALRVTGEITKEDNPELVRGFYKVEFTDADGVTHTGYVPTGYVSPFAFIENPPVETPDPDYSEDNLIKTVILVIIVIVLVLAAGGYIVYALWTGKFKKKDKNKDGK